MPTTVADPVLMDDIENLVLRSDKPTDSLYHYTDQKGLLGIATDKAIWATHYRCLNDTQEFLHAKDLFRAEIERRHKFANPDSRSVLEAMHSTLNAPGNEEVNLYVASFSEDGDSLPQWRAYGGQAAGFALGFRCDQLVLPSGFKMKRCIYDLRKQREIVEAIVTWQVKVAMEENTKLGPDESACSLEDVAAGIALSFILDQIALIFKHEKFHGEKEWRIISSNRKNPEPADLPPEEPKLAFREGKSMVTPYLGVPLKDDRGVFPLGGVVVGPNPNKEQSIQSVRSLLNSHELSFAAMKSISSAVPYRNW